MNKITADKVFFMVNKARIWHPNMSALIYKGFSSNWVQENAYKTRKNKFTSCNETRNEA